MSKLEKDKKKSNNAEAIRVFAILLKNEIK